MIRKSVQWFSEKIMHNLDGQPMLNGPLMLPLELRERTNGFFQSLR